MVGVVEHDLTSESLDLVWGDAFQSALGSNGHEHRSIDWSMGQSQDGGSSLGGAALGKDLPFQGGFHIAGDWLKSLNDGGRRWMDESGGNKGMNATGHVPSSTQQGINSGNSATNDLCPLLCVHLFFIRSFLTSFAYPPSNTTRRPCTEPRPLLPLHGASCSARLQPVLSVLLDHAPSAETSPPRTTKAVQWPPWNQPLSRSTSFDRPCGRSG